MNQKGYSWPEAILTLAIIIVVFGTLLPLVTKMTSMLHNKKMAMHAAETLYHGSIRYNSYGTMDGIRHVEGQEYEWIIYAQSICVGYSINREVVTKCMEY